MTNQVSFFECLCQLRSRLEWGGWATQFGALEKTIGNWFLKVPSWRRPPGTLHWTPFCSTSPLMSRFAKSLTSFYANLHKLLYLPLKIVIHLKIVFRPRHIAQCSFFFETTIPVVQLVSWFPIRVQSRRGVKGLGDGRHNSKVDLERTSRRCVAANLKVDPSQPSLIMLEHQHTTDLLLSLTASREQAQHLRKKTLTRWMHVQTAFCILHL